MDFGPWATSVTQMALVTAGALVLVLCIYYFGSKGGEGNSGRHTDVDPSVGNDGLQEGAKDVEGPDEPAGGFRWPVR